MSRTRVPQRQTVAREGDLLKVRGLGSLVGCPSWGVPVAGSSPCNAWDLGFGVEGLWLRVQGLKEVWKVCIPNQNTSN